jgi:hypothetical protein
VRPAESAIQDATPTESYGNFGLEKVTVLLMARWLLVKNRRPSGSWPVTIQDDDEGSRSKGADGEVRSWDELKDLAAGHGISHGDYGGPGLMEMITAFGPVPR